MVPAPPLPLRVCPRHGLVAGTDGRCVICHRDDDGAEGSGAGRRVAAWGLLFVALFGVVLVWKGLGGAPASAPTIIRGDVPAGPAPPPSVEEDEGPLPPTPEEARLAIRQRAELARQQDIEAEMHHVPVRVFISKQCEMCDAARAFLKQKGMTYSEVDVDADPDALAVMHKLTPGNQVPVFEVDGEVQVGFAPTNVLGALRRAAEKRRR